MTKNTYFFIYNISYNRTKNTYHIIAEGPFDWESEGLFIHAPRADAHLQQLTGIANRMML